MHLPVVRKGYKYEKYVSDKPRSLFGKPEWVCDKCSAVFPTFLKLKNHRWEHAYVLAALLAGGELAMNFASSLCC